MFDCDMVVALNILVLFSEVQQKTLSEDIWSSCGITAPSKCSNALVIKYLSY